MPRSRPDPALCGEAARHYARLLALAARPDLALRALAACLALGWARRGFDAPPVAGLPAAELRQLLGERFPGAAALMAIDWEALAARDGEGFEDETGDIAALLDEHARPGLPRWLARVIATGCRGDGHLWEDMGLASRDELSALLADGFPVLAARNRDDMKWKKFFYKQLCEREQITVCRAPHCSVCIDRVQCFGPEEGCGTGLFALSLSTQARLTPTIT